MKGLLLFQSSMNELGLLSRTETQLSVELLGVTVVTLIGLLYFKDVLKIFRLLKRAVE
jgi:hypothetical protein